MKRIYHAIIGSLSIIFYIFNLTMTSVICLLLAGVCYLIPVPRWRQRSRKILLTGVQTGWAVANQIVFFMGNHHQFRVEGPVIPPASHCVVMANHQSWADIIVMSLAFRGKLPPLKFFMKRELLWQLPGGGLVCWLLGFPFLYRHSKEAIRRKPELRDIDRKTTHRACQQFKKLPGALVIYAEGTRFSKEKHDRQRSPYKHLLKPKAAGLAIACHELSDVAPYVVDVSISYGRHSSFWSFVSGDGGPIVLRYELIPITDQLLGDYSGNREFRSAFQAWLNQAWQKKDDFLDQLKQTE